jgi:hypothetical protein
MTDRELIERLLFLAETAVDQALDLNYDDPEDYFIYRELRELKAAQLEQAESHRFCTDAIVRRVEALEAAQRAIRSGTESPLVERVADAIAGQATSAGIVNDRPARAAILEVAAWFRTERDSPETAAALEQEANR